MTETTQPPPARSQEPIPLKPTGPCWVCGAERWKRVFADAIDLRYWPALAPYDHGQHPPIYLVRCGACGFNQPEATPDLPNYFDAIYDRRLDEAALEADFAADYRDFVYRTILDDLDRLTRPGVPRSLLDVGCSTGRFLDRAARAGWAAEGAETDATTAAFAARRTGLPVHTRRAEDLAHDGRRFGVVTMNDVLEHIPKPAAVVRNLRALLEPGGILAIKVPHGPMQCLKETIRGRVRGRTDPIHQRVGVITNLCHVSLFGVRSIRKMLDDAGFEVLHVTTGPPELWPAASWKGRLRRAVRRSAFTAARVLPGGVHSPLAMNLQAYARRPS